MLDETTISDICASAEFFLGTILSRRIFRAIDFLDLKDLWNCDSAKPRTLVVSGGVACNRRIRSMIDYSCKLANCQAVFPPPKHCTDNGVMIAWNGVEKWNKNSDDIVPWNRVFDVDVYPRVPFGEDWSKNVIDANILNRRVNFKDL